MLARYRCPGEVFVITFDLRYHFSAATIVAGEEYVAESDSRDYVNHFVSVICDKLPRIVESVMPQIMECSTCNRSYKSITGCLYIGALYRSCGILGYIPKFVSHFLI